MRPVLAAFVAVVTLMSAASASPLAPIPVPAMDSNTLVISIGTTISDDDESTVVTLVDKISAASNSHQNGTSPPLPLGNTFGGTVGPNNTIYIVGTSLSEEHKEQPVFLSYDAQTDKWTTLPTPAFEHEPVSVVVVGSQLLAIRSYPLGHLRKHRDEHVYAFDLSAQSNQTWVAIPTPLPGSGLHSVCAVSHNDTVYYLVESGGLFRSSDGAQTWTQLASAPHARVSAGCAALDNVIVVAGGDGPESVLLPAMVYDIAKNEWHDTQPMSKVRGNAKAVGLPTAGGQSQVVVCAGVGGLFSYKDCEQLDLSTNQWSPAGFTLNAQFFLSWFGLFVVTQN